MSEHLSIAAEARTPNVPKGHQLRKTGRVPGVYYNAKRDVKYISFDKFELARLLRKEMAVLDLKVGGESLPCVIREVQRHPVFGDIIHVDLYGVDLSQSVRVRVPVHAVGTATGVKLQGGILDTVVYEVEIEGLPDAIPTHIDLDVSPLSVGDALRFEDIKLDGITVIGDPTSVILHVTGKKVEATEEGEVAEAGAAEPEVIREKKPAEE
ncbi:MAG: 50S ribosomal protein L25 [Calditrichaeota bacterium]|nr:50S ribosomal protein L25 [Calditrichota bacterium]MCB9367961.1 50S ribosomal protein L25 [Calditrichota bacterium]